VAIGVNALTTDTKGDRNVAVGHTALATQNFTTTTDAYNVAVGYDAGGDLTTGKQNTLIGGEAGDTLTTGNNNIAIGYLALQAETTGQRSVAVGTGALDAQNNASGDNVYNVGVGYSAGGAITSGTNNTCVGGLCADAMTTGSNNSFYGSGAAGTGTITGDNNTAMGVNAGGNLTSGDNNLLLGHDAGVTGSPGGNINNENNEIVLGDENITAAHIQVSFVAASDERDKTDFADLDLGLDFVKGLEPVTYYWDKRSKYGDKYADGYDLAAQTPDGTHKEDQMEVGFKAQAVRDLEEAAGYKVSDKKNLTLTLSGDGKQYGLKYERFVPILVKAIQDQDAIITSLTARVAALES
jgi:hypothetical protein